MSRSTRAPRRARNRVAPARLIEWVPSEFLIPTRIVLTAESMARVLELIEHPKPASPALRRAMRRL